LSLLSEQEKFARKNWTRDTEGNYIDWTQPPFYVRGVLHFMLPGETSIDFETLGKRTQEYMKLTRHRMTRRNKNGPAL